MPPVLGSNLNRCYSGLKLTSDDLFKARWNQARYVGFWFGWKIGIMMGSNWFEMMFSKPAGIEPALEGSDLNDCDSGLKLTSNDLFKARWNQARCARL